MAKRGVEDDGVVVIYDAATGQRIFNCVSSRAEDFAQQFGGAQVHDVRKDAEVGSMEIGGFDRDEMSGGTASALDAMAITILEHATRLAIALAKGHDVLVHCKNSRSRSPAVMAALFIVFRRGFSNEFVQRWLKMAFPVQRPDTAKHSVKDDFPNFARFAPELARLEECTISDPVLRSRTVRARVTELAGAAGVELKQLFIARKFDVDKQVQDLALADSKVSELCIGLSMPCTGVASSSLVDIWTTLSTKEDERRRGRGADDEVNEETRRARGARPRACGLALGALHEPRSYRSRPLLCVTPQSAPALAFTSEPASPR